MQDRELNIDEIVLRIPGVDEQEAYAIGRNAIQHIAENLPASFQSRNLESLDLRVTISPGTSVTAMTKIIAEAIMKGLT